MLIVKSVKAVFWGMAQPAVIWNVAKPLMINQAKEHTVLKPSTGYSASKCSSFIQH